MAEACVAGIAEGRKDIGRRYLRSAILTGFGGVTSRLLAGLAPIILARYLGPSRYGIYTLALSFVGIVAGASHLGQNAALQKFLPEYLVKDLRRAGVILWDTVFMVSGILVVLCLSFYFLSEWIATAVYHRAGLLHVFQFSALLVLALSLFNLALSVAAGLQDFGLFAKAMVLRSAGFLALGWMGVALFGLYGALGGQLLAVLLGLALLIFGGAKAVRERLSTRINVAFSRSALAEIFSFAFPAFLSGALVAPTYWWANTLLARDAGFAQVGLFGVAFAMVQIILMIPSSLSLPAVSFLSEVHASSPKEKFSKLVSTNVRLIWALALPLSLGSALFSPWIVRTTFGYAYLAAVPLVPLMSFVALLMAINSVIGDAVAGSGRMWHGLAINAFWLVFFGTLCLSLVPSWGVRGLVVAFAGSYFALAVGIHIYSRIVLRVRFERLGFLAAFTTVVMVSSAALLQAGFDSLTIALSLFLLVGVIAIDWKWVLTAQERSIFRTFLPCF